MELKILLNKDGCIEVIKDGASTDSLSLGECIEQIISELAIAGYPVHPKRRVPRYGYIKPMGERKKDALDEILHKSRLFLQFCCEVDPDDLSPSVFLKWNAILDNYEKVLKIERS